MNLLENKARKAREQGERTRDCSEVALVSEEGGWCKIKSGI